MGLEFDPTKYGMKDYAAELGKKYGEYSAYHRGRMDALSVTVPIGKTANANNTTKGLEVEKEETSNTPSAEEVQRNINYEGESATLTTAKELTTKKARKAAVEDAKNKFMQYGTSTDSTPIDEKQAKKMAENYVENKENLENMYSTRTYVDKEAYKKAEKERKAEYKELKKEYREQGMSRREAKRKAKAEMVNNEYLDNKKARAFVENNFEQFYDENGNLSQTKYKQFALGLTNTHTEADEANNAHLSLKERREAAETHHTKPSVVRDIARFAGADVERDNTGLYRTGFIVGVTGLATGAGALILPSVTAATGAAAGAGAGAAAGAGAGAAAGAGASATIEGVGAVAGAAIGATSSSLLSNFLKDKGNKEPDVYEPGNRFKRLPQPDDKPAKPPVQQPVQPQTPPQIQQPIEKPCPELRWESDICDHTVGKGDSWSAVAQSKVLINGKKPDGKILKAYVHAEKLKHGIDNFALNTMPNVFNQKRYDQLKNTNPEKAEEYRQKTTLRLYSDFADLLADEELVKKHPELELLRDTEITFNCDEKVSHNGYTGKPKKAYTSWFGAMTKQACYKQDCHDNMPVLIK